MQSSYCRFGKRKTAAGIDEQHSLVENNFQKDVGGPKGTLVLGAQFVSTSIVG